MTPAGRHRPLSRRKRSVYPPNANHFRRLFVGNQKALDRLIPTISPFFERSAKRFITSCGMIHPPISPVVGTLKGPDAECERIFETLVVRNAINLHSQQYAAAVVYRRFQRMNPGVTSKKLRKRTGVEKMILLLNGSPKRAHSTSASLWRISARPLEPNAECRPQPCASIPA